MSGDFSRRIDAKAFDRQNEIIPDAVFRWYIDGRYAGSGQSLGHSSIEVLDPTAIVSVDATVGAETQGPIKLAPDQTTCDFKFDTVVHPRWREFFMKHFPALVGIFFILLALALVFVFSSPTALQTHVLLALFALGGGGFGGEIAGFINADLTLSDKLKISAGGAAAIFVLLYFFVPAGSG